MSDVNNACEAATKVSAFIGSSTVNPFQTGPIAVLRLLFHLVKLCLTALPTAYILKKSWYRVYFVGASGTLGQMMAIAFLFHSHAELEKLCFHQCQPTWFNPHFLC
jgi:hypothetical protein